jgi:hypothetical protein
LCEASPLNPLPRQRRPRHHTPLPIPMRNASFFLGGGGLAGRPHQDPPRLHPLPGWRAALHRRRLPRAGLPRSHHHCAVRPPRCAAMAQDDTTFARGWHCSRTPTAAVGRLAVSSVRKPAEHKPPHPTPHPRHTQNAPSHVQYFYMHVVSNPLQCTPHHTHAHAHAHTHTHTHTHTCQPPSPPQASPLTTCTAWGAALAWASLGTASSSSSPRSGGTWRCWRGMGWWWGRRQRCPCSTARWALTQRWRGCVSWASCQTHHCVLG